MASRRFDTCVCRWRRMIPRHLIHRHEAASTCSSTRRGFTSSTSKRKHGAVPAFNETPSSELNDLLSTIRNRIFIPSHLSVPQQKLVYQARNHAILQNDPFYIDIQGESIKLEPIDRTKDVPDSWKSLLRALALMKAHASAAAPHDRAKTWNNLIPLLAGMKIAGRRWRSWQWELLIRRVGEAGAPHVLIEAIRQAPRTGLFLHELCIVRELLWAFRNKAVQADWDPEPTESAARYAEQLAVLSDEERHRPQLDATLAYEDPQKEPDVIGAIIELLAARLQVHQDVTPQHIGEARQRLKTYVERLLVKLDPSIMSPAEGTEQLAAQADYELLRWIPVYNGLRISDKVLGEEMPQRDMARDHSETLKKRLYDQKGTVVANEDRTAIEEKRRGVKWFELLDP